MTYSLDRKLHDRSEKFIEVSGFYLGDVTLEKLKMLKEFQVNGEDGRKRCKEGELCTSNAIPNTSKKQRLVGVSHTTILQWLLRE